MQPKKGERIRYTSKLQDVSQPLQVYALRLRDLWPRDQKVFAEKVESDTFRPSKTAQPLKKTLWWIADRFGPNGHLNENPVLI